MGGSEASILSVFQSNPSLELSTEDIVHALHPKECEEIADDLSNPVALKERKEEAKRTKARLHRKTLYYLNKLIGEGILKVSREGAKGHKYFSLALRPGEELIYGRKKKIVISKPDLETTRIDGYERKGVIFKYDPETWITRLNTVLLETKRFNNLEVLRETLERCLGQINDLVALNDFEWIVQSDQIDMVPQFLADLDADCEESGRSVCLIIDLTNLDERQLDRMRAFLEAYIELRPRHIRIVFDLTHKELRRHERFFSEVADLFSRERLKLYIKNDMLHTAPYAVGRGGPYTFDEEEWRTYIAENYGRTMGIVLGQTSIAIDLSRLFELYSTTSEFRNIVMNAMHVLSSANAMQRKRAEDYFREFIRMNRPHSKEFFQVSRNYLRFWNYTWSQAAFPEENFPELLQSVRDDVEEFCHSQSTIYKACGMPTRFAVAFSCAFRNFRPQELIEEPFKKLIIRRIEDFHTEESKEILTRREVISSIFDGGDRLRIYRVGTVEGEDIVRELNFLLTTYRIPFFCFDFSDRRVDNMSLQEFIE